MIENYINDAKRVSGLNSDRSLAKALGLNASIIPAYRNGRALPSDATMLQLSDLAGISHAEAMLDLAVLRSNSDTAKEVFLNLKKKLTTVFSFVLLALSLTNISNQDLCSKTQVKMCINTLYIMENTTVL